MFYTNYKITKILITSNAYCKFYKKRRRLTTAPSNEIENDLIIEKHIAGYNTCFKLTDKLSASRITLHIAVHDVVFGV